MMSNVDSQQCINYDGEQTHLVRLDVCGALAGSLLVFGIFLVRLFVLDAFARCSWSSSDVEGSGAARFLPFVSFAAEGSFIDRDTDADAAVAGCVARLGLRRASWG